MAAVQGTRVCYFNILAPEFKPFRTLETEQSNNLFYGVELEINPSRDSGAPFAEIVTKSLETIGESANIRPEGSCPYGYELVTIPATLLYHKTLLWKEYFANAAMHVEAGDGTGLHIHFSREALTPAQLAKVIYFIHETPNSRFLSKIAGRRVWAGAEWCKQSKKIYNGSEQGLASIVASESGQRRAIGISSHYNGRSVECRIFKSNPTEQGVFQALEFLDALIQYAGVCDNNEEALQYKAFLDWYKDTGKKTQYPYLYNNLVHLDYVEGPAKPTLLKMLLG